MVPFTVGGLTSVINQVLPEPHAGLLAGLLFGVKGTLDKDFSNALITSGTIHIVALSGQNLTILSELVSISLLRFIGKRWSLVATFLLVVWFVWFVGPSASIVRAAIMTSLSLLALFFGKAYWSIFSWILAVVTMLVLNPGWIVDTSFQLSALATLGIILFGGQTDIEKRVQWQKRFTDVQPDVEETVPQKHVGNFLVTLFGENLRLTLAAQTLTVPLIFWTFRRISLIAPVSNIAIAPIIGPLSYMGWITVLLGWLWNPLGQIIAWVDWFLLEYLIRMVSFFGNLPFASVTW